MRMPGDIDRGSYLPEPAGGPSWRLDFYLRSSPGFDQLIRDLQKSLSRRNVERCRSDVLVMPGGDWRWREVSHEVDLRTLADE